MEADGLLFNFLRLVPAEATKRVSLFTSVMQLEVTQIVSLYSFAPVDSSPCDYRLCGANTQHRLPLKKLNKKIPVTINM